MINVAVVIPFFQRKEGILRRTVESVLLQYHDATVSVFIVDDGSPVSAAQEIQNMNVPEGMRIEVISQRNAGPGAARNRGLEAITPDIDYVAFIDSDDQWLQGHLDNAINALERGFDFYFSDFYFADFKKASAFLRAGKIPLEKHRCIDKDRELFSYCGSMIDQILIKGNVIGTSNVVFRHSACPHLRFREEFFNGQDYLFWLDFAKQSKNFCFSSKVECNCDIGLNIYAGAGWGTDRSLDRLTNDLQLWKFVHTIYVTSPEQENANILRIARIRESIARDFLHRLLRRKLDRPALSRLFSVDKSMYFLLLPYCLSISINKLLGKSTR